MSNQKNQINILIADDHPLFLKGLRELLSEMPDWEIVDEAKDGQEALDLILAKSPDIAILDISMPYRNGLELAKHIHEHRLPVAVIILTMHDDELLFSRAASYGIRGFVLKESAVDDIILAVEKAINGQTFISPALTSRILNNSADNKTLQDIFQFKLTKTEQKVIKLIAEDYTTAEISKKLFISPKTVEHHRANICEKLNLSGKNALLKYALENKEIIAIALMDV
ncbi:MAG: response regulator transcription factor [Calditrichaeota bacterium]|nr:response regulator transcription factor [Calditrichota bacterium]